MAACVLGRRVPRLRYLRGLRKYFTQPQCEHVKREHATDDQGGKKGVLEHQDVSPQAGSILYYSPTSYYHAVWNSVSLHRQNPVTTDVEVDTRAYLKCRPEYASITLDLTQRPSPMEWEKAIPLLNEVTLLKGSMTQCAMSQFLAKLSHLQPDNMLSLKSDQRFTMFLRYCVQHLHLFTVPQLLEVLQSFVWLQMPSNHTVLSLLNAELSRRVNQMSLHQLLFAADLWRCIGRKIPHFLQHLYDSVRLNLRQMGVPELVQLLYIMGEGRHCPKYLIRPVEQLLTCHLQQLYPEEVGTVCLGLFKSQIVFSETTVTQSIIGKAVSFVEEMDDFAMVNVLKLLRFSYLFHKRWLNAMDREVPRRAHRMGIKGLMHVALACSALHYYSDNILTVIAERVPSLVHHCRCKDSSKLLWAFGTFGVLPAQIPSFYSSLIEDIRQKQAEFQQYPQHLLTGLLGLAFVSQFPEDLIALALSPDFVDLALKFPEMDLMKDLFALDGTVGLELPQWTGPRLNSNLTKKAADMLWMFAQSDLCKKPEVQEAESALRDLMGGEQFVCKRMILPHTRSIDLEVHLDSTGQPIPVNTESSPNNSFSCPPKMDWRKAALEVTITEDLLAQLINTTETLKPSPALELPSLHRVDLKVHLDSTGQPIPVNTESSPNNSFSCPPKKDWRKAALEVTITEDLLAQLINTTETLKPSPALEPPSLHRVELDEGMKPFDTMTNDLTESLTKPIRPDTALRDSNGTVKLAIQVNSRNHYCTLAQHMLGFHVLKRRQLKLAGYRVVELHYQEWFPMLNKSKAEKQEFLRRQIANSLP